MSGCGSTERAISRESILQVPIPGTAAASTSTSGDTVTRLLDVTGSWVQVSVDLSLTVQREGWQVDSLNCVGTGNDVIAKKRVSDRWLLLESGAGERGAGIIVRPDPGQLPPGELVVTGNCPRALVDSVS